MSCTNFIDNLFSRPPLPPVPLCECGSGAPAEYRISTGYNRRPTSRMVCEACYLDQRDYEDSQR
jgi:hypothetical protein